MSDTQTTGRYVAAPADTSMVGAVLGNYRITAALSSGGMGAVYRAQHELLDRPAAIKLLRPELTENVELVQRFFTEAKAATAIRHPGIVEVYDFGYTEDGHAYIVMEFLDGEPLSRAIAARGRFSEVEAASIARSIASALKAAHAKGIIHRDLKPDNVFLVPDPDGHQARVKVLDFGIAKLANPPTTADRRRTQTGVLMGTPKYMAPEQAREAGTIDHRADLYSLGCMLYELLCGEPPFVADGAGEIIAMQLFNNPEPLGHRVGITPELEKLVMRLLAKEPKERYQSAREVMEALVAVGALSSGVSGIISQQGVKLSSETRALMDTIPSTPRGDLVAPTHLDPPRKRSLLPLWLAGAAVAVAAGTVAFLISRKHHDARPAPPPTPIPVAAPAPPPVPVAQPEPPRVVEPAPAAPPVEVVAPEGKRKKPRVVKAAGSASETPKAPPIEQKLTTEKQSPIEVDIGPAPKQPKAP